LPEVVPIMPRIVGRGPMTRPIGPVARLARYGFADAARARDLLGPDGLNIWEEDTDGAEPLLDSFARAADPDLALRQLERAVEADRRGDGDLLDAVRSNAALRDRLIGVLGASSTLGDYLVANPGEWRAVTEPATDLAAAAAPRRLDLRSAQTKRVAPSSYPGRTPPGGGS
jgi:glutamate-ammonia-ligase adenylyltransferase